MVVWIECQNVTCRTPITGRRKYCSRECQHNSARTKVRAEHATKFIAVDGEGQMIDGQHQYVLLSVGDVSLHDHGKPLHYEDIFAFLWEEYEANPDAAFVGFYLGYDFTQWLRGLAENRARMLVTKAGKLARQRILSGGNRIPFPVHVGRWNIDILGTKRFKLQPQVSMDLDGKGPGWMYVCDCGPFFQSSFVQAIDPSKWVGEPVVTPEEFETILEGKANRSAATFGPEMIKYNLVENEVMARLMTNLEKGFVDADIHLKKNQWMGPGQASQKWMGNVRCPTGGEIRDVVPEWARDAARATYYGGWFEIFAHGHVPGPTYGYDINSAYPYVISTLPCLLHGSWTHGAGDMGTPMGTTTYTMVRAVVSGTDERCGAMLHRDRHGQISRPKTTEGWFWWHELEAAKRAGVVDRIQVSEWVQYEACDCGPPLAGIQDMYQRRLQVGKNTSSGKAYKLVYNSAYGKLAQSIGEPKYANPIWASLITAGCRTHILDAIATHPTQTNDLLMVATDGVYFRRPHDALELSADKLGAWDEEQKSNLTLFMPGMYWDDKTRHAIEEGRAPVLRSRGVSAGDLAQFVGEIDRQFTEWSPDDDWPTVSVTVKFNMVSMGQALARNDWPSCGTVVENGKRQLNAYCGTKREPWSVYEENGVFWSYPYDVAGELQSKPYDRLFGDELSERFAEDETLDPDGETIMLLAEAVLGAHVVDVPIPTY